MEQKIDDGLISSINQEELVQFLEDYSGLEPDEKTKALVKIAEYFEGPLPHPIILQGYNDVSPGAAEKIIENMLDESRHRRYIEAEESQHRRSMEAKVLNNASMDSRSGQTRGFIVALLGLVAGSAVIISTAIWSNGAAGMIGGAISGSVLSGGSIVALVGKFTGGRKKLSSHSGEDD